MSGMSENVSLASDRLREIHSTLCDTGRTVVASQQVRFQNVKATDPRLAARPMQADIFLEAV
jgi:hypothetical protein